jgi:hypothetical protein
MSNSIDYLPLFVVLLPFYTLLFKVQLAPSSLYLRRAAALISVSREQA